MTTNLEIWTEHIMKRARKELLRTWDEHWYAPLDRTPYDKRLLLVCVETGRVLAACVNPDALCAATRLLGGK